MKEQKTKIYQCEDGFYNEKGEFILKFHCEGHWKGNNYHIYHYATMGGFRWSKKYHSKNRLITHCIASICNVYHINPENIIHKERE